MSDAPETRPKRPWFFWMNLVGACVLAFLATLWFKDHLQRLFTEVVLIGGAFTLWAALRFVWDIVAGATEADVEDFVRRLLSTTEATRLLIVGAAALALVWGTTGSLYFELDANAAGATGAVISVRELDGTRARRDIKLTSEAPLAGGATFWAPTRKWLCHVVAPVGYDPEPCELRPRSATTLRFPGSFDRTETHLLRFVPGRSLFSDLPRPGNTGVTPFRLVVSAGDVQVLEVPDLRLGVVSTGAATAAEVQRLAALEDREQFAKELREHYLAQQMPSESADQAVASLLETADDRAARRFKQGERLLVRLERVPANEPPRIVVPDFEVVVDGSSAQTIWLEKP
jgi:hypothetical protein